MLRRWRKAAFRRFVFPKRLLSPRGTRAAGHIVPTHIMPRAALKHDKPVCLDVENLVPTHTMLRAALKHRTAEPPERAADVPTHIMPRAALKPRTSAAHMGEYRPDTHNAACGIETSFHSE